MEVYMSPWWGYRAWQGYMTGMVVVYVGMVGVHRMVGVLVRHGDTCQAYWGCMLL